jgi:hypothetical protein
VLYVFADSDPEYRRNLEFFVRFGITAGNDCNYIIVVQQVPQTWRPKRCSPKQLLTDSMLEPA